MLIDPGTLSPRCSGISAGCYGLRGRLMFVPGSGFIGFNVGP